MADYYWDVNGSTTGLGGQGTWDKSGLSANTWNTSGPPGNTTTVLWTDGNRAILTGSVASPPRATVRNNNMSASSIAFFGALGTTFTINYNNGTLTTGYISYVQSTLSVAVPLYGISKIQSNAGSTAVFSFSTYNMSSSTGLNLTAVNAGVSNTVRFINGSTNTFGGPITVENGVFLSLQSNSSPGGTSIQLLSSAKLGFLNTFTNTTVPPIIQAAGTVITASSTVGAPITYNNSVTCSGDVTNTNENNSLLTVNGGLNITGTMNLRAAAAGADYSISGQVTGSRLHLTSTVGTQRLTLSGSTNLLTGSCATGYFRLNNSGSYSNFLCQTSGTLELIGSYNQNITTLQLTGSGADTSGSLVNVSGNNSISGTIIVANATTLRATANTLSLTGTINTNNFAVTLTGSGNFALNADITGGNTFTCNTATRIKKQTVSCASNLTFGNGTLNFGS